MSTAALAEWRHLLSYSGRSAPLIGGCLHSTKDTPLRSVTFVPVDMTPIVGIISSVLLINGDDTISELLQNKKVYISFITELELIGYNKISLREETKIKKLLKDCIIVSLNEETKEAYVKLRRRYGLADSIIMASALCLHIPLITADRQFRVVEEVELLFL